MSEDNTQVEQITKQPEQKIEKVKDPKRVAAGKRLAMYHKKAKQALKNNDVVEDNNNSNWMPEISLTTVLTIVGISLTAADLYFRWKTNKPKNNIEEYKPKINIEEHKPKINNEAVKPSIQPSKIPKRIGME